MAGVSGEVLVERDGPILAMTLNRPEVRNAVNHATAEAMARALDLLDGDDQISAGIVTGAGGTFCSGIDLKAFVRGERPEIAGRGFAAITHRRRRANRSSPQWRDSHWLEAASWCSHATWSWPRPAPPSACPR